MFDLGLGALGCLGSLAPGKGVQDAPPGYAAIAIRANGVVNIVRIGSPGSSSTPVIKVG